MKPETTRMVRMWDRKIQQWVSLSTSNLICMETVVREGAPESAVVAYLNPGSGCYAYFDDNDTMLVATQNLFVTPVVETLAAWKQHHRIPLAEAPGPKLRKFNRFSDLRDHERRAALAIVEDEAGMRDIPVSVAQGVAENLLFSGPTDFAEKLHSALSLALGDGGVAGSPEGTHELPEGEQVVDVYAAMAKDLQNTSYSSQRLQAKMFNFAAGYAVIDDTRDPDEYEDWLAVGRELHSKTNGSVGGRNVWHDFSKKSFKYDAAKVDAMWDQFNTQTDEHAPLKGAFSFDEPVKISFTFPEDGRHFISNTPELDYGADEAYFREPSDDSEETTSEVRRDFVQAATDSDHPYHELAGVLLKAFEQAAMGKGKERHANDLPFTEQKMQTICHGQGHLGGLIYQISKKAMEAERMPHAAQVKELLGVIVYAAGAVIYSEQKEQQS